MHDMQNTLFATHDIQPFEPYRSEALRHLELSLDQLASHAFAELWVNHIQFPALCALINVSRGCGFLMALRYDGDAGFTTRSGASSGNREGRIEYLLGNGQLDTYPISWALPTDAVVAALRHFARTTRVPDELCWHNDSDDGLSTPNDSGFVVPE